MKTIFAVLILFLTISFISCKNANGLNSKEPQAAVFVDSLPGSSPFLAKDAAGNVVLSWIRELSDSAFIFCYAVSTDGGATFKAPIAIPASSNIKPHSENLPKVVFKPSGEIIALWGAASRNLKNKYAGMVFYAQSFDGGKSWTDAKPLVKDTAGYDQRYFDVSLLPNGEAGIIWLDNRKATAQDGSALFYATTSGTAGFGNEKRISQPCCQCCRTDLYVDAKNNLHVLYRGIIQDSIRDMVHIVSTDGGKNFSAPTRISNDNWVLKACPHTGPAMTENENGLHFAWYTGGGHKGTFYTRSANNGQSFALRDSISVAGKHPQIATGADGKLAIVWDENVPVADRFYSRIGIQTRNATGGHLQKTFITPDSVNATYPVIAMAKTGQPLVAYCQKKNEKNFIAYQQISLP